MSRWRSVPGENGYVPYNARPLGGHEMLLRQAGTPRKALDVGCSTGYLSRRLVERGASVIGLEADRDAAASAEQWCERVLVGDVENMDLPFEERAFDLVLCGDLLEHLRAPGAFLARMRPLIAPGGRLVLTTPNVANWAVRLSLLFGRFRYGERGILDRTHTHLFTRKTLLEALSGAGYRIADLDFTVPVPVVGRPALEALAHRIGELRPSLFAYQFVVAAEPR